MNTRSVQPDNSLTMDNTTGRTMTQGGVECSSCCPCADTHLPLLVHPLGVRVHEVVGSAPLHHLQLPLVAVGRGRGGCQLGINPLIGLHQYSNLCSRTIQDNSARQYACGLLLKCDLASGGGCPP